MAGQTNAQTNTNDTQLDAQNFMTKPLELARVMTSRTRDAPAYPQGSESASGSTNVALATDRSR